MSDENSELNRLRKENDELRATVEELTTRAHFWKTKYFELLYTPPTKPGAPTDRGQTLSEGVGGSRIVDSRTERFQAAQPPVTFSTGQCLIDGCNGSYNEFGRCTTCGDVD